ncbi:TOMM precursor leader peptide-binding protein [Nonomuraea pusilla]|uniref:Bacteriocin biosynthesis cyclodehydratase domain-containing protein n=1 Tax=Nonomuraea pusilla TaxID=46177 RepID=A0A1H8F9A2_9ACTN|nr:TOMM precursor leader peptide-binding protein [Nonomuraea pusilla]SEN28309.1 bacteriocin biosynthesis cyclodehydratase domain-containing protein [Nonomuraea pusilla]
MPKIQVNPAFPLFVDDARERVRLGDFPPTGQILDPAPPPLRRLLRLCAETPVERDALPALVPEVPPAELDAAVERLLAARILVTDADLDVLAADAPLSRLALFLSMFHPAQEAASALAGLAGRHVAVLGAGAIGGAVALHLATSGVGALTLLDDDRVEPANLHRQHLYTGRDVGTPKIEAAARTLREHCPGLEVTTVERRITGPADVVTAADLVVNTVDTPQPHIRRWVNRACVEAGTPFVTGGFNQHTGLVGPLVVPGKTGCLACQERALASRYGSRELPSSDNPGRTIPSFGPLCGIVSGMLASEVIRYLTGTGAPAVEGRSVWLDLLTFTTTGWDFDRLPDCEVCG